MNKINAILSNKLYIQCMRDISIQERDRKYCCHGIEHSLDVARIAYIITLERGLSFSKELIYAMALLHDIGRCEEYSDKVPHAQAGAKLAETILEECDFSKEDTELICRAVLTHKNKSERDDESLDSLLVYADRISRNCFACSSYDGCYWNEELKNKNITY